MREVPAQPSPAHTLYGTGLQLHSVSRTPFPPHRHPHPSHPPRITLRPFLEPASPHNQPALHPIFTALFKPVHPSQPPSLTTPCPTAQIRNFICFFKNRAAATAADAWLHPAPVKSHCTHQRGASRAPVRCRLLPALALLVGMTPGQQHPLGLGAACCRGLPSLARTLPCAALAPSCSAGSRYPTFARHSPHHRSGSGGRRSARPMPLRAQQPGREESLEASVRCTCVPRSWAPHCRPAPHRRMHREGRVQPAACLFTRTAHVNCHPPSTHCSPAPR